ncbi:MAG: Panacea domain-containing protein [Mangrovicoccus sp.]
MNINADLADPSVPVSDALNVANEILKIAKREGLALTPMQLVKLTYIAHGWSLAILERDLFQDRIEAWKYGPVIPVLYHATKKYGRGVIPLDLIDEDTPSPFDADVTALLEDVVAKYGNLSGYALSNLTHRDGSPWQQVFREGVMNIPIGDEIISQHYGEKLDAYRRSTS